ncbi:MAG: GNAT family N-acetyltransferase [Pirellulales bacterium]
MDELRIELHRCIVRSWEEGDASDLATHANSREIWLNLRDEFPHPYRRDDAVSFLGFCREQDPETFFAIEVDGQAAGGIGFRVGMDVERTSAEVGYWLGEKFWNRGVVTEALVAVREYAIETHSLTRVYAVPFEWNQASFRVLEKAGFVMEGRLRRSAVKDGKVVDQLMYAYVVPTE